MNNTMVGADLAKEVIQVCTYTNKKVRSNLEMTHHEFKEWLFSNKPTHIFFEACGMSNYWHYLTLRALAALPLKIYKSRFLMKYVHGDEKSYFYLC